MARDPFAPVTQPSIPPWVWIIAGTFAVLLIGMGATAFLVSSHRNAVQPVMAAPAQPAARDATPAAPAATATASAATAGAPDKAADKPADDKEDRGEPRHRAGHRRSKGGAAAAKPGPAAPAAPAAPVKKKTNNMSQKEIDNLLGL